MLVAAFVFGIMALVAAIAIADSRTGAGIALAWIIAVLLYARHALRCPLCGASVLNAPAGRGLRWIVATDRRCARCMAKHEDAVSARASPNPSRTKAAPGGRTENRK